MMQHIKNIFHLGIKELIELVRDKCMLILIVYAFTIGIFIAAKGTVEPVMRAPIAVVDEDRTQLSQRIIDAFLPPLFDEPEVVTLREADQGMDAGKFTFSVVIPQDFQKNVLSGKDPQIQVNVDATRMTQAFVGAGDIQQIISDEVRKFASRTESSSATAAQLDLRNRFNPNLIPMWFGGVNQLVNIISMLAMVLIGAALIRERERGTLEHLLVMPVEPFEIMCAKIWSMMVVVFIATFVSMTVVLQSMLKMPMDGSMGLFMCGIALHLFAITSMGIGLACIARNMPQMGMLLILVLMPMNMLSGGQTPKESMPVWIQEFMKLAPTTHFVEFSQQIIFRGAGIEVAWKPFLFLFVIGTVLFVYSLSRFKKSAA